MTITLTTLTANGPYDLNRVARSFSLHVCKCMYVCMNVVCKVYMYYICMYVRMYVGMLYACMYAHACFNKQTSYVFVE